MIFRIEQGLGNALAMEADLATCDGLHRHGIVLDPPLPGAHRWLMSTMLVEIYDALKEAGASEEKARAAAASLTGRDDRLDRVEHRLDHVEQRLDRLEQKVDRIETSVVQIAKELAGVQAQIGLLKWMNGIVIAGLAALILPAYFP